MEGCTEDPFVDCKSAREGNSGNAHKDSSEHGSLNAQVEGEPRDDTHPSHCMFMTTGQEELRRHEQVSADCVCFVRRN